MSRLLRLGFDMDGVLADFAGAFLDIVNYEFKTDLKVENWTDYGGETHPDLFTDKQWSKGWEILQKTPFFWGLLDPCANVDFDMLNTQMETFMFNGYFVTRRSNLSGEGITDANALSRIWLGNMGVDNYSAVISNTSSDQRIKVLQAYEVDAYLDDWGEQVVKCQQAGINAYLIDRPYNQNIDVPNRVKSVQEYVAKATGIAWPEGVTLEKRKRDRNFNEMGA